MRNQFHRLGAVAVGIFLLAGPGVATDIPVRSADLDRDGDVDDYDVYIFTTCISGAGMIPVSICETADLSGDGDVDQSDFGLLQRCISGTDVPADEACAWLGPHLVYEDSGCLPTFLLDDDYPWCGDDTVEVTVEGSLVRIVHRNATYNCCPDEIRVDFTLGDATILVTETEILTNPCTCLCCYDIESVIVDLPAGFYRLDYSWAEWPGGGSCYSEVIRIR